MLGGPDRDNYEFLKERVDPFFLAYALTYGLGLKRVYEVEELAKENRDMVEAQLHS